MNGPSRASKGGGREPVQVYLDADDQDRLERLVSQLGSTKSDVLRRGLEALELRLVSPAEHPALRIVGILGEHDRELADEEERSWPLEPDPWPGV